MSARMSSMPRSSNSPKEDYSRLTPDERAYLIRMLKTAEALQRQIAALAQELEMALETLAFMREICSN